MTINVTITKPNTFNAYGVLLTVGSSYDLPDELAKSLISQLRATDTNGVLASFSLIGIPQLLWNDRPLASANKGNQFRFSDVGGGALNTGFAGGGNYFFSNGIRWRPVNNSIVLDSVDTANAGIANTTEQNLNPNHIVIPAGVINNYDRLRLWTSMSKSAGVDSTTVNIRFGPLGTIADPILSTVTTLATTNQSIGFLTEFKRNSATTMQKQGNASTDVSYNGASAGVYPAAVTVANMDTTPMYLSITSQLAAGTEIVTLQDYTLEMYATDSQ